MQISLEGRYALVGGASQGIGLATAHVLAEAGARVILMARRLEVLESIRASLPRAGEHRVLALDLERTEDVSNLITRLVADVGPIAVWVNNSGGPKSGPLTEASPEEIERAMRGHVLASQVILRALVPGMRMQGYGRIINVLSTSVKAPIPNLGVSNTVRAAMAAWAKSLVPELGPLGITVNNILPGYTDTPRLDQIAQATAKRLGQSKDDVLRDWQEQTPLRRLGDPRDVAKAIAFLASPEAGFISGVHLPVDGGRTGAH